MALEDAALYEAPFEIVKSQVKPTRDGLRRANHREKWWIHGEGEGERKTEGQEKWQVT